MSKVWAKIKCAVKEFFNFLSNLCVPVLAGVCVLLELFQAPTSAIQAVKRAEEWCYKASGTKHIVDGFVNKVGDAIEKTEEGSEIDDLINKKIEEKKNTENEKTDNSDKE